MWTIRMALALVTGGALVLGAAQAAPEKLLPDKSEVVFSVNVKGLVDSDLAKKYDASGKVRDALKAQPQAQAILEQLHLDPLKDVHSVTVALAGIKVGHNNHPEMPDEVLVIIRGNFEQDRIVGALTAFAAASPDKLTITDQGATKIFEFKEKQPSNFAAFADSKTIVASPKKETVVAALQRNSSQLSSSLATLLGKVDDKATFWAVMGKELLKGSPQGGAALNSIEGATVTVNVQSDVKLEALLHTTGADAAKQMRQQFEGVMAFAKGMIQGNPDVPKPLADSLNTLQLSEKGNAVAVNMVVTGEAIEKLLEAAKNLPSRPAGNRREKDKDK